MTAICHTDANCDRNTNGDPDAITAIRTATQAYRARQCLRPVTGTLLPQPECSGCRVCRSRLAVCGLDLRCSQSGKSTLAHHYGSPDHHCPFSTGCAAAAARTDPYTLLLLSMAGGDFIGNIRFEDEDIVAYNRTTGEWSLLFDGSDVGFASADVDVLGDHKPGFFRTEAEPTGHNSRSGYG